MSKSGNLNKGMSKTEEIAKEKYSIDRGDDTQKTSGIDMQRASDFIEGYEQATEDICEWLRVNLCNYFDAPRSMFDMCLEHLKQAMKNE